MNEQQWGGEGRIDPARVALRRAREDARLHRFTERTPAAGRRRVRGRKGRTPPVLLGRALLDLFDVAAVPPMPAWTSVAGPLARHVTPAAFDSATGTLTLASSSAAWLTQTRLLADRLVPALNDVLGAGTVRGLRLVKKEPSTVLRPLPLPPAPESLRAQQEPALQLPDPAIAAALNRQARQLPREAAQFTLRG